MIWPFSKKQSTEDARIKATREYTDAMVKNMTSAFKDLGNIISSKIDESLKSKSIPVIEGDRQTVYGFYLCKRMNSFTASTHPSMGGMANQSMLVIVIDSNITGAQKKMHDIIEKSALIPSEWDIVISNSLDIILNGKRVADKDNDAIVPADSYISTLMHARDNFTETPYDKGIFTRVINKVKQKYAKPS